MQLWKPRLDRVSLLDAFPYRGTGKHDLHEGRGDRCYKGKYSALIPLFSQCTIATLRCRPKRDLPA